MAKITLEYDTVEKELEVYQDGKKVEDVMEIIFQKYGDEARMQLSCRCEKEDDSMTTMTHTYAKQENINKLQQDIIKYLSAKCGDSKRKPRK